VFLYYSMVMKNLGIFHGVTYAMIKTIGHDTFLEKYPFLKEKIYSDVPGFREFFDDAAKTTLKMMEVKEISFSRELLLK